MDRHAGINWSAVCAGAITRALEDIEGDSPSKLTVEQRLELLEIAAFGKRNIT